MNTVAKGDAFEKKALSIIKNLIEDKRITVMEDAYRIYEKQPYYSHDRKGNIIFDLTIEVKPPGAEKYSIIYIIECKDYKTPISIDRLEAFCGKIEQIAPRNSKAIFITSSRFQRAAKNYADSKGVMLVGVDSDNSYNIILYNGKDGNNRMPFFTSGTVKLDQGEQYLEKEVDVALLSGIKDIKGTIRNISNYSKEDIELIANEVLNEIDTDILSAESDVTSVSKENLVQYVKGLGLKIKNTDDPKILGCFDSSKGVIQVNHSLYPQKRYKFVLAHEIGHYLIHNGNISDSESLYIMPDSEYNFRTNRRELKNDKNWIEWQANYFATCLTMPKYPFVAMLMRFQQYLNFREGHIYLDDQPSNLHDFIKLTNEMSVHFELSKTCIINRITELGLLTNNSRMKSIGQIMNEYQQDLIM